MSTEDPMKTPIKGGHGIARMLKEHGVRYIFGIPDGHSLAFYDGMLQTEGIKHILTCDERTAAFAADAYARVTGTLGVCDAGAAGAMNFTVGLAEAKGAASPVLALVGVVKSKDMLRNVPHDIAVAETLAPLTKWTGKVLVSDHLPRFLSYAIRTAVNGRPGPVALVVAEDILTATETPLKEFIPRAGGSCSINGCRTTPSENEIDYAVKLIRKAKQPAIFSGSEAILSGAFAEVTKLSQILNAPVFSTIMGKGIMVPTAENNYFGTVGLFGEMPNHKYLRSNCDLLLVVGNRLTEDDTANFKIPPQKLEMIQIDLDPAIIGLSYSTWGVVGDPQIALTMLIHRLEQEGITDSPNNDEIMAQRTKAIVDLRADHLRYREKDQGKWINAEPIKPPRVLKAILDATGPEDFLVTDASSSSRWIGPYYPVRSLGRKIITARGVGPTGFGVGALLGTCIAVNDIYPEDQRPHVTLFSGDGGFQNAGLSDLETLVRLKLDCAIVLINNSELGFVKFGQGLQYNRRFFDTDRPTTNFARILEAFGGKGYVVEKLSDLDSKIKEANNTKGVNLVDVRVDPMEFLPPNYY